MCKFSLKIGVYLDKDTGDVYSIIYRRWEILAVEDSELPIDCQMILN